VLHILALLAATSVEPMVSTAWLEAHLTDPQVRIVVTGDRGIYDRGHVPGARFIDHMETVGMQTGAGGMEHRMLPFADLAKSLAAKAGAADGTHIVLYGDSPMQTGWIYMTLAATGHADDVSMLDGGINLWRAENRAVSTDAPPPVSGGIYTVRPAPDVVVDAAYVKQRLQSPEIKVLDVRTQMEWNNGHLPGATLILWQDLYADQRMQKFKSIDEIRALIMKTGLTPNQSVVTYCAVGLRASLMYWAVRTAGIPARVYVGSWQDWQRDSGNPIVKP
jgi:thiosulfate/3-mercaptopyruvate sulfurtransferase